MIQREAINFKLGVMMKITNNLFILFMIVLGLNMASAGTLTDSFEYADISEMQTAGWEFANTAYPDFIERPLTAYDGAALIRFEITAGTETSLRKYLMPANTSDCTVSLMFYHDPDNGYDATDSFMVFSNDPGDAVYKYIIATVSGGKVSYRFNSSVVNPMVEPQTGWNKIELQYNTNGSQVDADIYVNDVHQVSLSDAIGFKRIGLGRSWSAGTAAYDCVTVTTSSETIVESFEHTSIAELEADGWLYTVNSGTAEYVLTHVAPYDGVKSCLFPSGDSQNAVEKTFYSTDIMDCDVSVKLYYDPDNGFDPTAASYLNFSNIHDSATIPYHRVLVYIGSDQKFDIRTIGTSWSNTGWRSSTNEVTARKGWNTIHMKYTSAASDNMEIYFNGILAETLTNPYGFRRMAVGKNWSTSAVVMYDDIQIENHTDSTTLADSFEYADVAEMSTAGWVTSLTPGTPTFYQLSPCPVYDQMQSVEFNYSTVNSATRQFFDYDVTDCSVSLCFLHDPDNNYSSVFNYFGIYDLAGHRIFLSNQGSVFRTRDMAGWRAAVSGAVNVGWNEMKVDIDASGTCEVYLNDSLIDTISTNGIAGLNSIKIGNAWAPNSTQNAVYDDLKIVMEKVASVPSPEVGETDVLPTASFSWLVSEDVLSDTLYLKAVPYGDLDGDMDVDLTDLAAFVEHYLVDDLVADINEDGEVNLIDFTLLAEGWQTTAQFVETATFTHDPETNPGDVAPGQRCSYQLPSGLDEGRTYYWRVDTTNTDSNVTTGAIWDFKVARPESIVWLYQNYPDLVEGLFSQLDLTPTELSDVSAAVSQNDYPQACKALLEYYKNGTSGSWLRKPPVPSGTGTVAEAEAIVNDDLFDFQNAPAVVPRTEAGGLDWTYRGPLNDIEWAFYLNRLNHITNVLLPAYRDTGNIRYAKRIDEDIRDWVLHCPYSGSPYNPQWRGLEAAFRTYLWLDVFYELMDDNQLSDSTKILILTSLPDHADYLQTYHQAGTNWIVMEMRGLATVGVGWPEYTSSGTWSNYAFNTIEPQIEAQVLADGAHYELTSSYHRVSLVHFEGIAELARQSGRTLAQIYNDRLEQMWNYAAMTVRPDGFSPLNNDCDREDRHDFITDASSVYSRPDWLYVITNGAQGTQPAGEASVFFPWAGQLISRSGWDANAHWSFFDFGPYGANHYHRDKLHFSASAYGRDILVDGGRFSYQGEMAATYRDYAVGTASHNVVRIVGTDQGLDDYVNTAAQTDDCEITAGYDFAKGTQTGGYTNTDGVAENTRMVRYERGKYWIIVDRFATDRSMSIEAMWHYHPDCTVAADGLEVTSNDAGEGNIRIVPVGSSVNWSLDIVQGQLTPKVQGWYSPEYGIAQASPAVIYSADISDDAVFAWLIVPGQGMPDQMSAEILSSDETSVTIKVTEAPGVENTVIMNY